MINRILNFPFVPKHVRNENVAGKLEAEAQELLTNAHNSEGQEERDHHDQFKGKKNLERQCNYLNWNLARLLEISTLL